MALASFDIHRRSGDWKRALEGPLRRDGVCCCEMDGEAVLYDVAHHALHYLNETAFCIWRHCDGAHNTELLADALADMFGVDIATAEDRSELIDDVNATLENFRSNGLLDEANGYRQWLG